MDLFNLPLNGAHLNIDIHASHEAAPMLDRHDDGGHQQFPARGFINSVCPQSRLLCGQTLHLLQFCTKTVRKMPILR
jgi:hypothetical protein